MRGRPGQAPGAKVVGSASKGGGLRKCLEAARGRGHIRPSASSLSPHGCEWAGVGGNRPVLGVSSSHMPPVV